MRTRSKVRWLWATILGAAVLILPAAPALAVPADLSVSMVDAPDPVVAGTNLTYTIGVTNLEAADASTVALTDLLPPNTTFASLTAPAGWACTTPAVGGTGAVSCSATTLAASTSASFTLVVNVDLATPNGTVITNTAGVTSTEDPISTNDSASSTTTVIGGANLLVLKSDAPDPVPSGGNITYTLSVRNDGPTEAASVVLTDVIPTGTTFVSISPVIGWTCTTPLVGGTGTVSCTNPSLAATALSTFTLVVNVAAGTAGGTVITNTATVSSATTDPDAANNTATTTTTVGLVEDLCALPTAIVGTNQSDVLTGTPGDDIICGGNGKDTINGLGGNDVIAGQNGKDELDGDEGNDTVMGANGKDLVIGDLGIDVLRGGNGPDTLNAQDGAAGDSLDGGNGPDACLVDTGDVSVNC